MLASIVALCNTRPSLFVEIYSGLLNQLCRHPAARGEVIHSDLA